MNPWITRPQAARILNTYVLDVRELERRQVLRAVVDPRDGVPRLLRTGVVAVATAAMGMPLPYSGPLTAFVFRLFAEGLTFGEIVDATDLSVFGVRALWREHQTPFGEEYPLHDRVLVEREAREDARLDYELRRRRFQWDGPEGVWRIRAPRARASCGTRWDATERVWTISGTAADAIRRRSTK